MLEFEKRTEKQKNMLQAVGNFMSEAGENTNFRDSLTNLFAQIMSGHGELAQYADMFLSTTNSALPVKLNTIRLFTYYRNEDQDEGLGIPKFMYTYNPTKYGVTAMGFAAISSGKDGKEQITNKYLPELMSGKTFCYCITEPDAGTNTHKISTTAVHDGDHFVLNGQKTFISAADVAHYMVVIAKIITEGQQEAIGTFIMDSKLEGIEMTPLDIAVLGDNQYTVYFDNVILPRDSLVGSKKARKEGGISESVFYTLNLERIMISFLMLRICQEALDKAVERAKQQKGPGRPPMGSNQSVKLKLARVKLKLELANLATKRATEEYDKKGVPAVVGMYANMAKLVSTDAANEACEAALHIYGVEGLNKDMDIGPLYQISRMFKVAPINNEMVLNFLGEHLLGLPKSYR